MNTDKSPGGPASLQAVPWWRAQLQLGRGSQGREPSISVRLVWISGALLLASTTLAQPAAQKLTPNLESNIERPLRYRPDGADFVIENGAEFFNRPLYGGNTAFRVDGGDKPEFVLYLPGRGGNLRFAINQVERTDPSALGGMAGKRNALWSARSTFHSFLNLHRL